MQNPLKGLKFDNDPENIIHDTLDILICSPDILSHDFTDELLLKLRQKTSFIDVMVTTTCNSVAKRVIENQHNVKHWVKQMSRY